MLTNTTTYTHEVLTTGIKLRDMSIFSVEQNALLSLRITHRGYVLVSSDLGKLVGH